MNNTILCPECEKWLGVENIGAEVIVEMSVSDWSTREIVAVREYYCDHCGATLPFEETEQYINEKESA